MEREIEQNLSLWYVFRQLLGPFEEPLGGFFSLIYHLKAH